MAVQPFHVRRGRGHRAYYFIASPDAATHVCFALDDLPELAERLVADVEHAHPDDDRGLAAAFLDRLRGTTPGADDPVHP